MASLFPAGIWVQGISGAVHAVGGVVLLLVDASLITSAALYINAPNSPKLRATSHDASAPFRGRPVHASELRVDDRACGRLARPSTRVLRLAHIVRQA
ncbi:hypothetical protein DWG18_02110 [Lysobacter sp. TY2-98]|uniref:hypothetical protein n=1 Tax=Lysobacter sp. TY2-98 TaxID=2290922 RepID=UPI000E200063|nr:hypothetical protein [Lysobacter sp. TY2-98]AXK71197.1 hypothetical protein DWG18_02110 [Lysobacter sp. TY2-98]